MEDVGQGLTHFVVHTMSCYSLCTIQAHSVNYEMVVGMISGMIKGKKR